MGLVLLESFDDGLYDERAFTGLGTPSVTYGKDGKGLRVGDTPGGYVAFPISVSSGVTFTFGFNFQPKENTATGHVAAWARTQGSDSLSFQDSIHLTLFEGSLSVEDRTGSTAVATLVYDTWYYIELKTYFHDTAGTWDLRVDGVSVGTGTSRDTLSPNAPLYLQIGGDYIYDYNDFYLDNIYVTDGTGTANTGFLGITKVGVLLPNGNGNSSVLAGSDGNSTDNYLLVDNNASIPPATTEYVESITEGDKDTYTMDDLTGTPIVLGVVASLYATKTDSGAKYMRPVIRSGSTDYPGSSLALADSTYTFSEDAWDVDPNTSSQWLYGGVNSMEVGAEVRDS